MALNPDFNPLEELELLYSQTPSQSRARHRKNKHKRSTSHLSESIIDVFFSLFFIFSFFFFFFLFFLSLTHSRGAIFSGQWPICPQPKFAKKNLGAKFEALKAHLEPTWSSEGAQFGPPKAPQELHRKCKTNIEPILRSWSPIWSANLKKISKNILRSKKLLSIIFSLKILRALRAGPYTSKYLRSLHAWVETLKQIPLVGIGAWPTIPLSTLHSPEGFGPTGILKFFTRNFQKKLGKISKNL